MRKEKGFTLIEILVSVAIIGILVSITSINAREARAKARDARRISDLAEIKAALQLYKVENGTYPPIYARSVVPAEWDALENMLRPYLSKLPTDPINGPGKTYDGVSVGYTYPQNGYAYNYWASCLYNCTGASPAGSAFDLQVRYETKNGKGCLQKQNAYKILDWNNGVASTNDTCLIYSGTCSGAGVSVFTDEGNLPAPPPTSCGGGGK